jgi:hypothetical protein
LKDIKSIKNYVNINYYNILKAVNNFKAHKYKLNECNSKIISGLIKRERGVKIIEKIIKII